MDGPKTGETLADYNREATSSSAVVDDVMTESSDESGSEDDNCNEEEGSATEDELSGSDSDSSTGDSNKCPICLLRFKGQAIGFPEVCGHPFCLDCILEWSKNVKTCPNDRRPFEKILVRLDLEGEIIRSIPVANNVKEAEEEAPFEVTHCQVCGRSDREDELLLCDGCDCGFHLDCLTPPLDSVPIEDWFCARCDGSGPAQPAPRVPLAVRVRRTIERNRQLALLESGNPVRIRRPVKKRRKTRRRKYRTTKSKIKSPTKGKAKGKAKRKTYRRRKRATKKPAVPTPRKRIADALGVTHERNAPPEANGSSFSLMGNPNSLDFAGVLDEEDDRIIDRLQSRTVDQPKSLIALLAERRKAAKSIYCFGPSALPAASAKPARPAVVAAAVSAPSTSGGIDLLGSILASQSQLKQFGKTPEAPRPSSSANRSTNSSNRQLAAILASQATLTRLGLQQGDTNSQPSAGSSSTGQSTAPEGQSSGSCGTSGGSSGADHKNASSRTGNGGDDPERNRNGRKIKSDPEDATDNSEESEGREEEDVDLYSDIESMEEEQPVPSSTTTVEQTLPATEEEEREMDEDDDKGLVIDDTHPAEEDTKFQPPPTGEVGPVHSEGACETQPLPESARPTDIPSDEDKTPEADHIRLSDPPPVAPPKRFHGGLPAAAAALSVGPKSGMTSRSQVRTRSGIQPRTPLINEVMKANLVSSLASALKETLTSALAQAQSEREEQDDSLAPPRNPEEQEKPTYSCNESDASKRPDSTEPAEQNGRTQVEVALPEAQPEAEPEAVPNHNGEQSPKKKSKKKKLAEIFGSDEDEPMDSGEKDSALTKELPEQELSDLEQVSDCEEGELDESEEAEKSIDEPEKRRTPRSAGSRRIVMMMTPPRDGTANEWGEEGEIIDSKRMKKAKKEKKKKEEEAKSSAAPETNPEEDDPDDVLRSAGIGGERKVELSAVDGDGVPTTFKKLDSNKTRHYRHQGEIKVVEGHTRPESKEIEPEVKQRPSTGSSSKRQELKRYDVRKVIEMRTSRSERRLSRKSRSRSPATNGRSRSRSRSAQRRTKEAGRSGRSKEAKRRRKKSSSLSLSPSPDRRDADRLDRKKRSRSRSKSKNRKERKELGRKRSRSRSVDETVGSKDNKKRKKNKHKEKDKEKNKEKREKKAKDGANHHHPPDHKEHKHKERHHHHHKDSEIEIPSKAVFASGDKIVVSLHFGGQNASASSPVPPTAVKSEKTKKKRKADDHHRHKRPPKEESLDERKNPVTPPAPPSPKSPPSPKYPESSPSPKSPPSPPPSKKKTETPSARKVTPPPTAPPLPSGPPPASSAQVKMPAGRGGARGGRSFRSPRVRMGHRGKPVLIDIETSQEIPIPPSASHAAGDVIVLSDSEDSGRRSSETPPLPPSTPPLPPNPPPPPPPTVQAPPVPAPAPATGIRGKGARPGPLAGKAAVKFSLTSKTLSLKKVLNPIFSTAMDDEDAQSDPDEAKKTPSGNVSTEGAKDEAEKIAPPPPPPPPPAALLLQQQPPPPSQQPEAPPAPPAKVSTSPIFRPPTPPPPLPQLPPVSMSYDPSQPTNTPSMSSTPSPSPSPPRISLPPPPNPHTLVPNFPPPHPGAVLMPPMASLPPPPLPPASMLASSGFVVNPALLSGVFHHHQFLTAAGIVTAPPPCVVTAPPPPLPVGLKPNSIPLPPPVVARTIGPPPAPAPSSSATATSAAPPGRMTGGRPMTPPSPTPSEGSDIFGPPSLSPSSPAEVAVTSSAHRNQTPAKSSRSAHPPHPASTSSSATKSKSTFDSLKGSSSTSKPSQHHSHRSQPPSGSKSGGRKSDRSGSKPTSKSTGSQPQTATGPNPVNPAVTSSGGDVLEEVPSSAVELQVKEKFLKKLNRQERVVEEVRLALKPYYTSKRITKADYKEILRRCVPKICHTKSGEINPMKIKEMVKGYVKKFRYQNKKQDPPTHPPH